LLAETEGKRAIKSIHRFSGRSETRFVYRVSTKIDKTYTDANTGCI
jgi:hypothetical protein